MKQLHDKATRGMTLSVDEQDQQESALLGPTGSSQRLAALHSQIDAALAQLLTVTQRIPELTAHNESVRCEITLSVIPGDQP